MFNVIGTNTYLTEIKKWTKTDREAAEKLPKKLAENPFVGDQLTYPFLREKRVYYLVYDDLQLVLLVATSGKKDQQETIDHIKSQLDEYRKIADEIARRVS